MCPDLSLEVCREEVVLQQDAVLQDLVPPGVPVRCGVSRTHFSTRRIFPMNFPAVPKLCHIQSFLFGFNRLYRVQCATAPEQVIEIT